MKKLIFLCSAIFIMAVSIIVFVSVNKQSSTSNALVNANIEALSDGELTSPEWWVKEHFGGTAITCTEGGNDPCV